MILVIAVIVCFSTIAYLVLNGNDILDDLNKSYLSKKKEYENTLNRMIRELSKNNSFDVDKKLHDLSIEEKTNYIYHYIVKNNDLKNRMKLLDFIDEYNSFVDFYNTEVEKNYSIMPEDKIKKIEKITINRQTEK